MIALQECLFIFEFNTVQVAPKRKTGGSARMGFHSAIWNLLVVYEAFCVLFILGVNYRKVPTFGRQLDMCDGITCSIR